MRPGPSLRPGLVGETPDLETVGTASLIVRRPQQRHRARWNGERHALVEGRLALQDRIGLTAAYMKDAQAAVVRVGGEEPLAVVREGQRLAKLRVHAVARGLGHVGEGALL